MKISAKPTFSKPGMVIKKKFEMQDVGPTDQDLKVLAEIEKAEKERQKLAEEGRKINIKPMPMPTKGLRPYGDGSMAKLQRMDQNQASAASLKKVEETFIAPLKLV